MVFEPSPERYTDVELRDAELLAVDIPNCPEGCNVYAAHYASGQLHFFGGADRVEARAIALQYGLRILPHDELVSVHAL